MKILKIIAGLIITLTVVSCDDILDTTPYSVITTESMWQTETDAISGVAGMYSQYRSTFNGNNFLFWFEIRNGFWQYGASGGGAGTDVWEDLFYNTLNAGSSPGTDWSNFYKTINAANLVIKYLPNIDFNDEDKRSTLLADAYFVRASCYFALARIWGDVPVVTSGYESVDVDNLYPERDNVSLVFDQVKADIDLALSNIADNGVRDRLMASKAGINMLKADVYLWTAKRLNGGAADLQIASGAVDQVLSDSNYELLDNYEQVFRVEGNSELIFSIYFDLSEADGQYGSQFAYGNAQVPSEYHNNPVMIGAHAQWFTFNNNYVENYLNKSGNDLRVSIVNEDYVTESQTFRWVNKFKGDWVDGARNFVSDTRIYRYAEAILFKAEILNATGSTANAVAYLNQIAKRAYGVDDFYSTSLSQEEVDDAILDERLIEFGAEGKAWFDIIRFGKAFEKIPSLVGRENDNEGNILLFPISPSTITKNPKIIQTPGY